VIEHIFIRSERGARPLEQSRVEVVAGAGIRGDRYFDARDEPGQNITFIEAEEIEAFARRTGLEVNASSTGRNVVTRGVRLNELVGKDFEIGGLRFRGVELCEPCLIFGNSLSTATHPPATVVKEWVRRAGLRAEALSSGTLAVAARFQIGE
jgi:MOSC domain-containing protein YiiM